MDTELVPREGDNLTSRVEATLLQEWIELTLVHFERFRDAETMYELLRVFRDALLMGGDYNASLKRMLESSDELQDKLQAMLAAVQSQEEENRLLAQTQTQDQSQKEGESGRFPTLAEVAMKELT